MRRTSVFSLIGVVLALTGTASAGPGLIGGTRSSAGAASSQLGVQPPVPATGRPTVSATTLFVSGRGWGHGVGMSQYGALGFATDGTTYEQILAHFYPGTALGPAPVARVRVLLRELQPSLTVSSPVPFRVRDVFGKTYGLQAGKLELGPLLEVTLNGTRTPLAGPIVFLPGSRPLELGTPYRGQIEVSVSGRKLTAVNAVGLEQYLAGVVPSEMPAAWHQEALRAQAVAARSYALAHRLAGKGFDLYPDVRSQVYGGVAAEDVRATAAIDATAGRVLLHDGRIADTLFHSTSGGRTAAAAEVFGKNVPYLVSVDDPFSSLSPVHRWGPIVVGEGLTRRGLGLRSPLLGLRLVREPSGRVRTAVVRTALGETNVSGTDFRRGLELRSSWITSLATLTLTRPSLPTVFGRSVLVRGEATGAGGLVLAQRSDGVWKPVLTRVAGGTFTFRTKLRGPTSFRLGAAGLVGPVLKFPVAPLVRAMREAAAISGSVSPALPGAAVEVQRLDANLWVSAGLAVVDGAGSFRVELQPTQGSYRAVVAPAAGYAGGISATLRIAG